MTPNSRARIALSLSAVLVTAVLQSCQGASGADSAFTALAPAPAPEVASESAPLPIDPSDQGDLGDGGYDGGRSERLSIEAQAENDADYRDALVLPFAFPTPITGTVEQARGQAAKGTLVNASAIPNDGDGFVKVFRSRGRVWGTIDIISILQSAASEMKSRFPAGERLQIGDIANKNGGQAGGHSSHQNGTDMDVIYFRKNMKEVLDSSDFAESFVVKGKVTSNFDTARNWELLKYIVSTKRVNRIFVDQAIKKHFCSYSKEIGEYSSNTETLRRLRPWALHDDHFHLRINCPAKSPKCETQEAPASGSGC